MSTEKKPVDKKESLKKSWETRLQGKTYPQWVLEEMADPQEKEMLLNHQIRNKDKVKWICPVHGVYEQRLGSHVKSDGSRGQSCRRCQSSHNVCQRISQPKPYEIKQSAYGDTMMSEVGKFLTDFGYEMHGNVDLFNDGSLIVPYYIPEKNLAVYCADTHVEFEVGPRYVQQKQNKMKAYDAWYKAHALGIRLIWIQDFVWYERKNKLKQIITNALVPGKVVYARKTEAVTIDNRLAQQFCNLYHIDGCAYQQKYSVGLVMKGDKVTLDTLLQVMTFSGRRFSHESDQAYECARMCVKAGYNVVGGTSKMLSKFIQDCRPMSILSYSANTWFSGNGYDSIGFESVGDSGPSYQWVSFHGPLQVGTYSSYPEEYWTTETGGPFRLSRESVQCGAFLHYYPDLFNDVYNNPDKYPISSVESKLCSTVGLYKVHNCGNTRHMMYLLYSNDPRTFVKASPKDVVVPPYYCGDYSNPKFDINNRLHTVPKSYQEV